MNICGCACDERFRLSHGFTNAVFRTYGRRLLHRPICEACGMVGPIFLSMIGWLE